MTNRVDADALTIERVKRLLALRTDQVPLAGGAPNPMHGHSETLIFSRVTGHPDCPDVEQWFDASECWVCNRHSKCSITVAHCHELQDGEFNELIWLGAVTREWAEVRQSGAQGAGRLKVLEEAVPDSEARSSEHCTTDTDSSGSGLRRRAGTYTNKEFEYLKKQAPPVEETLRAAMKYGNHEMQKFEEEQGSDDDEHAGDDKGGRRRGTALNRPTGRRIGSFAHFHETRNVIPVSRQTAKQLDRSVKLTANPDSNLTLFTENLTAKPIQLKSI